MKILAKLSLLALSAAFATVVAAQETTEEVDDQFPIGTEPPVQVGQPYLIEKVGDWDVRCVKLEEQPEPCHIYQLLKNEQGNPVAEISFFHLPGGGAAVLGASAVTPLGTLLQNQLIFSIDGGAPKQYPFNWCETIGCIARMGFTGLELESLKKGTNATMTIASVVAPGKPVVLTISLKGFSEGFKKVLVKP